MRVQVAKTLTYDIVGLTEEEYGQLRIALLHAEGVTMIPSPGASREYRDLYSRLVTTYGED